jgi:hypothetical protein
MAIFVCYDVKGIQSFIFKVPELKYIIGGSAIIDRFDRETMPALNDKPNGIEIISHAGGKGAFRCKDETVADTVEKRIVAAGHNVGLEIRIGRAPTFKEAAQEATKTYSFLPASFDGEPCDKSGLYPQDGTGNINSTIELRKREKKYFEKTLKEYLKGAAWVSDFEFFNNPQTQASVIGNRNRWAVICMDGNDVGAQYRKVSEGDKEIDFEWLKKMSIALDTCTRQATCAGIQEVVKRWEDDGGEGNVLPIRPIVVGGDDVTVLCHVNYAFDFVKEVCRVFNNNSKLYKDCWPATNGEITISAGVLFCPVTMPLHSAIPYAEALLASAKQAGRKSVQTGYASPPSIDWEQITEGVLDTPAARRQRELKFFDEGAGYGLEFTRRPYLLSDFAKLEAKAEIFRGIPNTVRASILPNLHQPLNERLAFYARIKKNYLHLFDALSEFGDTPGPGWRQKESSEGIVYDTSLLDAFLLLEEDKRMTQTTTESN